MLSINDCESQKRYHGLYSHVTNIYVSGIPNVVRWPLQEQGAKRVIKIWITYPTYTKKIRQVIKREKKCI